MERPAQAAGAAQQDMAHGRAGGEARENAAGRTVGTIAAGKLGMGRSPNLVDGRKTPKKIATL